MSLEIKITQDGISYKIDKETGIFVCFDCQQLMLVFKVADDDRLVCLDCAIASMRNKRRVALQNN